MILDWLLPEALAASVQAAVDLEATPSVWGMIMVNLFAALPPTIAAITAMIIAWRSSKKQDTAASKQDEAALLAKQAARSATAAVVKAQESVEQVAHVAEERMSTVNEDADRATQAVNKIVEEMRKTRDDLCDSLKINRALMERILAEVQKKS